MTISTVNLKYT